MNNDRRKSPLLFLKRKSVRGGRDALQLGLVMGSPIHLDSPNSRQSGSLRTPTFFSRGPSGFKKLNISLIIKIMQYHINVWKTNFKKAYINLKIKEKCSFNTSMDEFRLNQKPHVRRTLSLPFLPPHYGAFLFLASH